MAPFETDAIQNLPEGLCVHLSSLSRLFHFLCVLESIQLKTSFLCFKPESCEISPAIMRSAWCGMMDRPALPTFQQTLTQHSNDNVQLSGHWALLDSVLSPVYPELSYWLEH